MAVSKEEFDAHQAAEIAATTDYIAAVDAFIALPQVVDLQAEDDAVNAAAQAVKEARSRVPIAPAPPGP